MDKTKRIIVAITGATGVVYGIRLLEALRGKAVESHLIVSPSAADVIAMETDVSLEDVQAMASKTYNYHDLAAPLSSGSFRVDGMVIMPCTIKTLSGIANSYTDNLIVRAADVTLKERRRLVLSVRETPLHTGHLRLMTAASELGAILLPPVPAFYHKPETIDDIINHTVGKALDLLGIDHDLYKRWNGKEQA